MADKLWKDYKRHRGKEKMIGVLATLQSFDDSSMRYLCTEDFKKMLEQSDFALKEKEKTMQLVDFIFVLITCMKNQSLRHYFTAYISNMAYQSRHPAFMYMLGLGHFFRVQIKQTIVQSQWTFFNHLTDLQLIDNPEPVLPDLKCEKGMNKLEICLDHVC